MRIAVYGSAETERAEVMQQAYKLGTLIAGRGHTLITGACGGVPLEAVKGAFAKGGMVIGYSPARNIEEHRVWGMPEEGFSKFVFIPDTYEHAGNALLCKKARNISSVAACEAAIFVAGKIGTLNEFTIAYDLQKPIGVLRGTGRISDLLPEITEKIQKEPHPPLIFSESAEGLLMKIEQVWNHSSLLPPSSAGPV